ncbi:MAG: glycerophosphodiester phosphodiesterase [Phycisphaeraceae bacterium]|nr:glycerophosphodiester phosphodiesterase [Phycisphaeraceae bacterium]
MGQQIVAHRGASFDAPENTLASFRLAWEQGADAIEGDFYLTSDGQIVCMHDKTTKRTTNADLPVAASTFEQLRALDAGSWKDPRYAGEQIPTLDEVLATVPPDKYILIEIKSGPEILPALKQSLDRAGLEPWQTRIICFKQEVITAVKQQLPELAAVWLSSYKQDEQTGAWTPTIDTVVETIQRLDADGFGSKAEDAVVDEAFVARLRQMDLHLNAWTVDEPEQFARYQQLGFDTITTNRPGFIKQLMAQAGQ